MPVVNIPPILISSGSLDTAFGGNGLTNTAIGAGEDQARGIVIQPDGRYVVAGWSDTGGGNYDFAVVRFNADGSLDTSFSGYGKQTTQIAAGTFADQAYGIAAQADGKIVVAGSTNDGTTDDFAIVRYNANGSLDTGFSGDGIQTTSLSAADDGATAIAIQTDGKILVTGWSDFSFAIARYDSTGLLDPTFDAYGLFTGSFGSDTSVANAMALQPDGKIIIAGYGYSGTSWDFGVARLTAAGAFDSTFSGDGKALFHVNSTGFDVEEFKAIAIQSDGRILLAGRTVGAVGGDTFDAILMRLDTGGNPDTSFGGGDGMVTLNLSSWDEFNSVVVQADGKILAAGSVQTGFGEGLIARFNADGTLDTSFNSGGVFSTVFDNGTSAIYGLAIAPDGQVVAAGDSYTGTYDFGVLRLATGVPDQSAMADSAFGYTIPADAFFDADGNPLTYTATLANDAALPAWLSFDAATRTFSGTPAVGDFGADEVKVTASDGSASVSANFQLEVTTDFIEALRITDHPRWNSASPNGTPGTSLSFSFMDVAPLYGTATETSTFAPMTLAEEQAVRDVLQLYQEIAGVSFTEVADAGMGGQLRFGTYSQTGAANAAYAYDPGSYEQCGDVWINRDSAGYDTPISGDYSFETLIHEIGHALGLKHPGPYGGGVPPYLAAGVDNTQYTVMSYNSRTDALYREVTGTTANDIHFIDVNASTQMLYDVAAMQFIYGANTATRSGNDIYTFDPALPFFKAIWDGGGTDTISVSNFTEACTIDLRAGYYSSIRMVSDPLPQGFSGGTQPTYLGIDNLAISLGCIIENAIGGSGNDILTGNDASNNLEGGAGGDTFTGAGGSDVFAFATSGNGIDAITDFTLGDTITITGATFTGAVAAGDGSAVLSNQIQLASSGGTTTLYIGTDSTAGADVQIQLTGTFAANAFASYGNTIALNSTPTGSVTISGTATQGEILTASNDLADADGLGTIGYQWKAGGTDIAGATGNTYLLTQAEVGKAISVVASYTDGHGTAESVASNSSASVSAAVAPTSTTTTSKYFITQSPGANLLDLELAYGALSLDGQAYVYSGSSAADAVFVHPGIVFDFVGSSASADKLYLTGNYADYTGSIAGTTMTLTRTVGQQTETVKFAKAANTGASDKLIFADGTINTFDLSAYLNNTATVGAPIPGGETSAAPSLPATLDATVKAYAVDSTGETFAPVGPGMNLIAIGGSGVDTVYVNAGTDADAASLGGNTDKIYFAGNWSEYTKSVLGTSITFARMVGADAETVKVSAATGANNDRLVFADGCVLSNDAKTALQADYAVTTGGILHPTTGATLWSTAEVTPLGTGDIVAGTTGTDTLNGTAAGDTLYGNGGADTINGGAGDDTIVISDTGTTAASSATIVLTSTANGADTVIGFGAAATGSGGDVLDLSAIAGLADSVATGLTLATDFAANNVFIFDGTPVTIDEAANAIANDASVAATQGYIVIADSANHNAVTVYHSADLAANGTETALVILSGVDITQLAAGNFWV